MIISKIGASIGMDDRQLQEMLNKMISDSAEMHQTAINNIEQTFKDFNRKVTGKEEETKEEDDHPKPLAEGTPVVVDMALANCKLCGRQIMVKRDLLDTHDFYCKGSCFDSERQKRSVLLLDDQ